MRDVQVDLRVAKQLGAACALHLQVHVAGLQPGGGGGGGTCYTPLIQACLPIKRTPTWYMKQDRNRLAQAVTF